MEMHEYIDKHTRLANKKWFSSLWENWAELT